MGRNATFLADAAIAADTIHHRRNRIPALLAIVSVRISPFASNDPLVSNFRGDVIQPTGCLRRNQGKVDRPSILFAFVGDNVNADAAHSVIAHRDDAVVTGRDARNREDPKVVCRGCLHHLVVLNQNRPDAANIHRTAVEFVNLMNTTNQSSIFSQADRVVLHARCRSRLRGKQGQSVGSVQGCRVTGSLFGYKPAVNPELQIGSKVANPIEVDGRLVFDCLNQQLLWHAELNGLSVVNCVEAKGKKGVLAKADQGVSPLLHIREGEIAISISSRLGQHSAAGEQIDRDLGGIDIGSAEDAALQQAIVAEQHPVGPQLIAEDCSASSRSGFVPAGKLLPHQDLLVWLRFRQR